MTSEDVLVVNFNDYGSAAALDEAFGNRWRYIGRAVRRHKMNASPLGNKFTVEKYGREDAIERYRRWLWPQLSQFEHSGESVSDAVEALLDMPEDVVLVCWCAPKACHGNVVKDALAWLKETKG